MIWWLNYALVNSMWLIAMIRSENTTTIFGLISPS
jgi:hypothetical protein